MLTLRDLAKLTAVTPHLGDISLEEATSFIRLAKLVRPQIEFALVDKRAPPALLPPHIHEFIGASLRKSYTEVNWYWYALKDAVWSESTIRATKTDVAMFHSHGLHRGIGYRDILPPTRVCLSPGCRNYRNTDDVKTLSEPVSYRATLFTLHEGALPVHTTSLYCHLCHRRYHLNYMVDKARSVRTYYHGPPPMVIQISTHFFVESSVLELFGNMMMFGWLSAQNCARVYNTSLASIDTVRQNNPVAFNADMGQPPLSWPYALEMSGEVAMNGFLLYSVLLDRAEHRSCLELPHDCPTQRDRLAMALAERNKAMEGVGQEEWNHACDLCFLVQETNNGQFVKIQYAVGDGLSMGRPCCAVHDCKIDLLTKKDVYCPAHAHLANICAVLNCKKRCERSFQTCDDAMHRALENAYRKDGPRAIHQLRSRLRASGVSIPGEPAPEEESSSQEVCEASSGSGLVPETRSSANDVDGEPVVVTMEISEAVMTGQGMGNSNLGLGSGSRISVSIRAEDDCGLLPDNAHSSCEGKDPVMKNVRPGLKARFGRRRTHNEQLIERPCGIILSRATFFGSEAVSGVKEHLKAVFPTSQSVPEIFIYDNNCKLREHINATGDTYFANTGLPVDVFHFKSKHRITDTQCQQYCNPAAFPDLVDGDRWRVNTSICEETNAWFGGYMAIVREMEAVRYTFFLDEMIKRRNRFTVKLLERRGHHPWNIPITTLFSSRP